VFDKKNVIAVTAVSETYPIADLAVAKQITRLLGVKHIIIKTAEFTNPDFVKNTKFRCYYCKSELFKKIREIASSFGTTTVFDGTNYDDLSDVRPGMKACKENNVISPLLINKLTKHDIRTLSKRLGLKTWAKPQAACLASRIPFNTPITKHNLKMVESAEQFLHNAGIQVVRVRHVVLNHATHGLIARIELDQSGFDMFMNNKLRVKTVDYLKKLGYNYVVVDLEGYRPAGTQS
jgi:uncharacterized protein